MATPRAKAEKGTENKDKEEHTKDDLQLEADRAALEGKYTLGKVLGEGSYGRVYEAVDVATGGRVAIKLIKRQTLSTDPKQLKQVQRELKGLSALAHPNINRLHRALQTNDSYVLVLDLVPGGETLLNYLRNLQGTSVEGKIAAPMMHQLVSAVEHCHKAGVAHRDIKAENILVSFKENKEVHVELADFGLSRTIDPNSPYMETRCGSPHYAAPEIIQGAKYDARKSDVWSLGVVFFAVFSGKLPFKGKTMQDIMQQILYGSVTFPKWFTDDMRSMFTEMFARNPQKRIAVEDIKHSEFWLKVCQFYGLPSEGVRAVAQLNIGPSTSEDGGPPLEATSPGARTSRSGSSSAVVVARKVDKEKEKEKEKEGGRVREEPAKASKEEESESIKPDDLMAVQSVRSFGGMPEAQKVHPAPAPAPESSKEVIAISSASGDNPRSPSTSTGSRPGSAAGGERSKIAPVIVRDLQRRPKRLDSPTSSTTSHSGWDSPTVTSPPLGPSSPPQQTPPSPASASSLKAKIRRSSVKQSTREQLPGATPSGELGPPPSPPARPVDLDKELPTPRERTSKYQRLKNAVRRLSKSN